MPAEPRSPRDDRVTIVAIARAACFLQNVLHEGVGHGVTAWLSGARQLTLSTVALQSDIETRWIAANGTLANLAAALFFWLLLRLRSYSPAMRLFLVLALAGNLFTGTGYFLFSGVFNFGDWADVIHGLHPLWLWRVGLIVVGVVSYAASMYVVGRELQPFQPSSRLFALCWIPYITAGTLALLGGLLNPMGKFLILASAMPATLGANAGLLSLPGMLQGERWRSAQSRDTVAVLRRTIAWIAVGGIAALVYIFVLGRGVNWSR